MCQICITDAGTTQDNFILPAPPVGGLPIFQNRLDKLKLVRNCTILVILPGGKNILVDMVFKISIGYTNPHWKEGNFLFSNALKMFYLRLYGVRHMVKDLQIAREETRCRHIGYSFRLAARILLYAPSHRQDNIYQDNIYHVFCYTSH